MKTEAINALTMISQMKKSYLSTRISKLDTDTVKSSIASAHGEQFAIDICRDTVKESNDRILCILNRTVLNSCNTDSDNIAVLLCKVHPLEQFDMSTIIHNIIDKSCDELHFSELYPRIVTRISQHHYIGTIFMDKYTTLLTERYNDTNGERTRQQLSTVDCPEHSNENYIDMRIKSRHTQLIKHIGILYSLNCVNTLFNTVMDDIRKGNNSVNDVYALFTVIKGVYNKNDLLDIITLYLNKSKGRDKFRLEELINSLNYNTNTVVAGTKNMVSAFKDSVPQPYVRYSNNQIKSNRNNQMKSNSNNQIKSNSNNQMKSNSNNQMKSNSNNQIKSNNQMKSNSNKNNNSVQIHSNEKNVYVLLAEEVNEVIAEEVIDNKIIVTDDVLKAISDTVREYTLTQNDDDFDYYLNELISKGYNEISLSVAFIVCALDTKTNKLPKRVKENCRNYKNTLSILTDYTDIPNLNTVYATLIQ